MRLVLYTAIFGQCTDVLQKLPKLSEGVTAHAYVDTVSSPRMDKKTGWELRPTVFEDEKHQRRARHHKIMAHELYPDVAQTMWVDGAVTPKRCPLEFSHTLKGDFDVYTYRHSKRLCLYQEVEACARMQKDIVHIIRAQGDYYREQAHPYHNGLAETPVVLRNQTDQIRKLNEAWWKEICDWSVRDQISFPFVVRKLGIEWGKFPGKAWNNNDFGWISHWK